MVATQFPSEEHLETIMANRASMDMDNDYYNKLAQHLDQKWSMGNYMADH